MRHPITPLQKEQSFRFACSPRIPCFNACCRDLVQVLTPYDVLCLKKHLAIPAGVFLQTYTEASIGPETGLPVVSLRFGTANDRACPFVTADGCRVYPARPASCRTYPLARGVSRDRQTGRLSEHWALIREPHCRGFDHGEPHTVASWIDDQRIAVHNQMNDELLELISLKNRRRPGALKPSEQTRIYTALYDLDAFRRDLDTGGGGPASIADPKDLGRARTDDSTLLRIALAWAKQIILGNTTEDL